MTTYTLPTKTKAPLVVVHVTRKHGAAIEGFAHTPAAAATKATKLARRYGIHAGSFIVIAPVIGGLVKVEVPE